VIRPINGQTFTQTVKSLQRGLGGEKILKNLGPRVKEGDLDGGGKRWLRVLDASCPKKSERGVWVVTESRKLDIGDPNIHHLQNPETQDLETLKGSFGSNRGPRSGEEIWAETGVVRKSEKKNCWSGCWRRGAIETGGCAGSGVLWGRRAITKTGGTHKKRLGGGTGSKGRKGPHSKVSRNEKHSGGKKLWGGGENGSRVWLGHYRAVAGLNWRQQGGKIYKTGSTTDQNSATDASPSMLVGNYRIDYLRWGMRFFKCKGGGPGLGKLPEDRIFSQETGARGSGGGGFKVAALAGGNDVFSRGVIPSTFEWPEGIANRRRTRLGEGAK